MGLRRSSRESAAAHVAPVVLALPSDPVYRVAEHALAHPAAVDSVFVVDADGRLTGVVAWAALLGAARDTPIEALAKPAPPCLPASTDQEQVALHAVRHKRPWVPIADAEGRFLGVVPPAALMAILHHEHVEDLHRLAGIRRETRQVSDALEQPPLRRVRHRLPWLLVGLAGSSLAAWVMSAFEATLAHNVAVAYFIPGVVYLADAVGTQTEAIAVRFLSLGQGPIRRVLFGEARTGFLLGLALAAPAFLIIAAVMADVRLAGAVALSLWVAATLATTIGLLFPWGLARVGVDPAFGSGPIATIVQDVLSLLVYFAIVTALMP